MHIVLMIKLLRLSKNKKRLRFEASDLPSESFAEGSKNAEEKRESERERGEASNQREIYHMRVRIVN